MFGVKDTLVCNVLQHCFVHTVVICFIGSCRFINHRRVVVVALAVFRQETRKRLLSWSYSLSQLRTRQNARIELSVAAVAPSLPGSRRVVFVLPTCHFWGCPKNERSVGSAGKEEEINASPLTFVCLVVRWSSPAATLFVTGGRRKQVSKKKINVRDQKPLAWNMRVTPP